MSSAERRITRSDILAFADYASQRSELRRRLVGVKRNRRVEVGPFATFYFENYDTMWLQVQEMLHIEKGGDAQVEGELETYNPLIPQGRELIATLMLEIADSTRRAQTLLQLGNIEECVALDMGVTRVPAVPTEYEDRTTPDGKTSSVHWLRFAFSDKQIRQFTSGEGRVVLEIAHPNYGHMAVLSPETRVSLAKDFM